jgi:tetratricopeptide (TPR) repeat protein
MQKEASIKNMAGVSEGIKKGLRNSEFDRGMYNTIGKNGSFEKVKIYEKNGIQRIIFRIYGDGLNYLDMELTKLENKVGIADMFIYMSGENISKTMAEFITRMTDNISEQKAEEAMEAFEGVKKLLAKGNFTQAKKEFDRLPMSIRNTRIADVIDIQITANLEEEKYLKAIGHFENKYANEPSIQLSMIDLYFAKKDYDKVLNSINVLDSLINKDSFLDYYRGLIYFAKGQNSQSIECYKRVVESNPKFAGPYEQLINYYVIKQEMENAKLYFSKYKTLPNADEGNITSYETLYPWLKE